MSNISQTEPKVTRNIKIFFIRNNLICLYRNSSIYFYKLNLFSLHRLYISLTTDLVLTQIVEMFSKKTTSVHNTSKHRFERMETVIIRTSRVMYLVAFSTIDHWNICNLDPYLYATAANYFGLYGPISYRHLPRRRFLNRSSFIVLTYSNTHHIQCTFNTCEAGKMHK